MTFRDWKPEGAGCTGASLREQRSTATLSAHDGRTGPSETRRRALADILEDYPHLEVSGLGRGSEQVASGSPAESPHDGVQAPLSFSRVT